VEIPDLTGVRVQPRRARTGRQFEDGARGVEQWWSPPGHVNTGRLCVTLCNATARRSRACRPLSLCPSPRTSPRFGRRASCRRRPSRRSSWKTSAVPALLRPSGVGGPRPLRHSCYGARGLVCGVTSTLLVTRLARRRPAATVSLAPLPQAHSPPSSLFRAARNQRFRLKPTMTPTAKLVAQADATPRLSIPWRNTQSSLPAREARKVALCVAVPRWHR
jgi:hypothetical protein